MIRFFITKADLEAKIENTVPGWLARAQAKTDKFIAMGRYEEPARETIWGEIKEVFIVLQAYKCAYCERELGGPGNSAEYDVEHYRPKSSVRLWPTKRKRKLEYAFPLGEASDRGYYRLVYNICNYAATCKRCNSSLKSNYFPVAKSRIFESDDYEELKNEDPHLLFPVGDTDADDPEQVITFFGFLPKAKETTGRRSERAQVTIDFFELDLREELIRARANIIRDIWERHEILNDPGASSENKARAQERLNEYIDDKSPHANCAKAYNKLCLEEVHLARRWYYCALPHAKKLERKELLERLRQVMAYFRETSTS